MTEPAKPCTCAGALGACDPNWAACGMSDEDWRVELAGVRFVFPDVELNVLAFDSPLFRWAQEQKP